MGHTSEQRRKYVAANRERIAANLRARHYRQSVVYGLWTAAKRRATKRGLEFTITKADIHVPTHCPVLGIPLVPRRDGKHLKNPGSPSLNRIDSSRGYTPENVWVISWRANDLKGDATLAELVALVCAWARLRP